MLTLDEQELVTLIDDHLDSGCGELYHKQPLAQDWARVCKVVEEAGEVVDALIGWTEQNPRKGEYSSPEEMYKELCDVALTAIFALQHFTKDAARTNSLLTQHLVFLKERLDKLNEAH